MGEMLQVKKMILLTIFVTIINLKGEEKGGKCSKPLSLLDRQ